MKKLGLLLILTLIFVVAKPISTQKALIDRKGYIELQDSAEIDTTNAKIRIMKVNIASIKANPIKASGSISIHLLYPMTYGKYTGLSDIKLDYKEFNAFDSNDELSEWLTEAWNEVYYEQFQYTGSDVNKITYSLAIGTDTTESYNDTIVYVGGNPTEIWTRY